MGHGASKVTETYLRHRGFRLLIFEKRKQYHEPQRIMSKDIKGRTEYITDEPSSFKSMPREHVQAFDNRQRHLPPTKFSQSITSLPPSRPKPKSVLQQPNALVTTVMRAADTNARWLEVSTSAPPCLSHRQNLTSSLQLRICSQTPFAPNCRLLPGIYFAYWNKKMHAIKIISVQNSTDIGNSRYVIRVAGHNSPEDHAVTRVNQAIAAPAAMAWARKNAAHFPSLKEGLLMP